MTLALLLLTALQDTRTDAVKGEIDRAIRELGSEKPGEREAAHAFLAFVGAHLRESLGKAAASKDPEVVERAKALGHPPASELERKVAEAEERAESMLDHGRELAWRISHLERELKATHESLAKVEAAAFELWISQWISEDPAVRRRAMEGLVEGGHSSFPVLRKIARDQTDPRRDLARSIAVALHVPLEEAARRRLRERLSDLEFSLDHRSITLDRFVDRLSAYTGLDIVVADPSSFPRVIENFRIREGTVEMIMDAATKPLGLRAVVTGGVLLITTEASPRLPGPDVREIHLLAGSNPSAEGMISSVLETLVNVDVKEGSLDEAARQIAAPVGLSLEFDPDVGDKPVGKLRLKGVTVAMALRLACLQAGADWTIDAKGAVRIVRPRK